MRIDASGNLGIGTNNPAFRLHVGGTGSQYALVSTTGTTSTTGVLFGDADSNSVGRIEYVHADNGMYFFTNGTTKAVIDTNGNCGIGTSSPAGRLSVNLGTATSNGAPASWDSTYAVFGGAGSASGSAVALGVGSQGGILSSLAPSSAWLQMNYLANFHVFYRVNAVEAMRIDSSGNVGIGTSSPSDRLHIVTNGTSVYNVFKASNANSTAVMVVGVGGSAVGATTLQNNAYLWNLGNSALSFGTNDTERMRITSGGALCVGTTSQEGSGLISVLCSSDGVSVRKTSATGWCFVTNSTTANSSVYQHAYFQANGAEVGKITSNTTNATYGTSSDYRLKENIVPMIGALEKVAQLKPVTYNWKIDNSVGQGFIAHELQEVCPDAVVGEKDDVNEDGSIKPQSVDTSYLVATLTAAIQEQQAMIETLTTRLNALEGK
jgi:hypothetical protein